MLTEPEAKAVIAAYGMAVPETLVAQSPQAVRERSGPPAEGVGKVVVKLLSKTITHKSDLGGVVLDIETADAARDAAAAIEQRVRKLSPDS